MLKRLLAALIAADACKAGTGTAHVSLGPTAAGHDRIPHSHDGGITCLHVNPTAGH